MFSIYNESGEKIVFPSFERSKNTPVPSVSTRVSSLSQTLSQDENGTCVKTYVSLLKDKKIEVLHHPQRGLSALISPLDSKGEALDKSLPLPLLNVPKEIATQKDVSQLQRFFEHTYLIPEKGMEGEDDRVAVYVRGCGGGKSKIPFQPGLSLGCVIRGECLEKMEAYAETVGAREAISEQIDAAEQRIEVLEAKIQSRAKSLKRKGSSGGEGKPDGLIDCWEAEQKSINENIKALTKKVQSSNKSGPPYFDGFQVAIESPIDMEKSVWGVQPRGFDSLNFSSQYIDMSEELSEIHDKVNHASSANSVALDGSIWMLKANASYSWSETTSQRLAKIKKEGQAKGVLMISATATTRHVRSFTHIHYDKIKLRQILEAMKNEDDPLRERYGITQGSKGPEIYLLTEAALGGSFTALVTFSDEQKMDRIINKKGEGKGSQLKGGFGADVPIWHNLSASIAGSHASQQGNQSEDDVLRNTTGSRVSIEINCCGAVPTFATHVIEHEIAKHLDLNPSKFELSEKDEASLEAMGSANVKEQSKAIFKQQMKEQNAGVALVNAYRGMTAVKEKQTLHNRDSVLEAYESFANKMATDSACGVPVGFNYQVLSQKMLEDILSKLEGPPKSPSPEQTSGQEVHTIELSNQETSQQGGVKRMRTDIEEPSGESKGENAGSSASKGKEKAGQSKKK